MTSTDRNFVLEFARLFEESTASKSDRMTSLSCLLLQLKEHNRSLYTELKAVKAVVHQERTAFDDTALELESAKYERVQIEAEISACREYPSKYQTLELVLLEEFQAGRMQPDEEDEHELMLARLDDELARRKVMMDEVKLAEIRRDAENEKLAKLLKELEALRDNTKTIYKMACSYKLVPATPSSVKIEVQKEALQLLFDELQAYIADLEDFQLDLFPAIIQTDKEKNMEDEEEGAIAASPEPSVEDDEEEEGHHQSAEWTNKPSSVRMHDFAHIQVLPPPSMYAGSIIFFHSKPTDMYSPIVLHVEDVQTLPLEDSLKLLSSRAVEPSENLPAGLAFKWIQVAAGLESDLAFTDAQRCLASLFQALSQHRPAASEEADAHEMNIGSPPIVDESMQTDSRETLD